MKVNSLLPNGPMELWEFREYLESFLYEIFLSLHWFATASKRSHYDIANSHLMLSLYCFKELSSCELDIPPPPIPLPSGEGVSNSFFDIDKQPG